MMKPLAAFETRHPADGTIAPHRHEAAYVAIVLEGGYEESSLDGTWLCEPGDWVVHPRWHFHANRFSGHRSRVLNFELPVPLSPGVWRPRDHAGIPPLDPDALAGLLPGLAPRAPRPLPESLSTFVSALRTEAPASVTHAARRAGLSREYASRLHRRYLGLSPRAVKAEERLRRALTLLAETPLPLSQVAIEAGFADQAHLTRTMRAATGRTPGDLRRSAQVTSVQ
jgi:AraC family transcriptional regulator